ncbi:MAG: restriction endonuclease subunit S [Chitinophagaceae bacterium]
MTTSIQHIAALSSGLYLRPGSGKELFYIQARHFPDNQSLSGDVQPELQYHASLEKHLLGRHDVLLAVKGNYNFAVSGSQLPSPAIASSIFLVIRIHSNLISADFLAWFLNLPASQQKLAAMSKGTSIASLNKTDVAQFEIPLPPLEKQELILKADMLFKERARLKKQIAALEETTFYTTILKQLQ